LLRPAGDGGGGGVEGRARRVQDLQHRPRDTRIGLEPLRGHRPPPAGEVGGVPRGVYPHLGQFDDQVDGRVRLGLPLPARGAGVHELDGGPRDCGRGVVAVVVVNEEGGAGFDIQIAALAGESRQALRVDRRPESGDEE